ncbi:MAG: hypothetical protein JNK03_14370 [Nitrospira sp.]|nr:hypothetical protein [Nitrospira sp.]
MATILALLVQTRNFIPNSAVEMSRGYDRSIATVGQWGREPVGWTEADETKAASA